MESLTCLLFPVKDVTCFPKNNGGTLSSFNHVSNTIRFALLKCHAGTEVFNKFKGERMEGI